MAVINSSDPLHAGTEIESLHENRDVAEALDETAQLLHDQNANEFRVRAYHAAANTIRSLPTSLQALVEHDGINGLIALPTIGKSIANLIHQYLQTGHMSLLDRLRGESHCEALFTTVPGIGRELAHRIHEHLHIETLCELDAAAWEGKLEQVPGIGAKRVQSIKDALAIRFAKGMSDAANENNTNVNAAAEKPDVHCPDCSVPVAELLDIDREYREKAISGQLPKISPAKLNPDNVAWLPILHTERGGRHYTALFSNTARAHELNTTQDWVVIFRDDAQSHGSWTVITSQFGKLQGSRIVRGREDECREHYNAQRIFHQPVAGQSPHPEIPSMWEDGHGRVTPN